MLRNDPNPYNMILLDEILNDGSPDFSGPCKKVLLLEYRFLTLTIFFYLVQSIKKVSARRPWKSRVSLETIGLPMDSYC